MNEIDDIELYIHYQSEEVSSYGLHLPDQLHEQQEPEQYNEEPPCQTAEIRNSPILTKS